MRPFLIFSSDTTDFSTGAERLLTPSAAEYTIEYRGAGSLHIEHPADAEGKWKSIVNGNIIFAPIYRRGVEKPQPFRIYKITKTRKNGRPTISADALHVFYDLNYVIFFPNTNYIEDSIDIDTWLNALSLETYIPYTEIDWHTHFHDVDPDYWKSPLDNFTFSSNIQGNKSIIVNGGTLCEHLVGTADSIVAKNNADLFCDQMHVYIDSRGTWTRSNAFTIAYGLNLNGVTQTVDDSNVLTLLRPTSNLEADNQYPSGYVYPGEKFATMGYPFSRLGTVDFNYQVDDDSNVNALWKKYYQTDAPGYFTKRSTPDVKYTVDLYAPQMPDEVQNIATLEVGDSGRIYDPDLGIDTTQMITRKVVNLLNQRVKSVELSNNKKERFSTDWGSIVSSGMTSLDKRVKSIL